MSQSNLFRQVTLSEEQLRAGLVQSVDEVQIPCEPIAMTEIRAAELEVSIHRVQ
jgi:hypothetical protein